MGTVPYSEHSSEDRVTPPPSHLVPRLGGPTLFIECTGTYTGALNTGIQRVVRNLLRHASEAAAHYGYTVVPVVLEYGRFIPVDPTQLLTGNLVQSTTQPFVGPLRRIWRLLLRGLTFLLPFAETRRFCYTPPHQFGLAWCVVLPARVLGLHPWPNRLDRLSVIDQAEFGCSGSILLLLDASWAYPIWPEVRRFRRSGGKVVGIIHDIISVTHPDDFMPETATMFRRWLQELLRRADALVCVSRSTAEQVVAFKAKMQRHRKACPSLRVVDHFMLGSELDLVEPGARVRPDLERMFTNGKHAFLVVGSIEPRKNHAYILDAFDVLWARGEEASLVILGRQGWKTESFLRRVADHPQRDKQLFLVRDASDTDLDYAYRSASALIIASKIEGFGLPVVEAFQRGLPVLCSDIPVFREIVAGKATFFDLSHPQHLIDAVRHFCRTNNPWQRGTRQPQSWISWRESAEQLCDSIMRAVNPPMEPEQREADTLISRTLQSCRQSAAAISKSLLSGRAKH